MTEASLDSLATKLARLEEKFSAAQSAIVKQAIEYERRLGELNHAHAQLQEDRGRYLTFEVFDAKYNQQSEQIESKTSRISTRLELVEKWKAQVMGMAIGIATASSIITALIMKVLK